MIGWRWLLTEQQWQEFAPAYLALLLALAFMAGGALTERWAYRPRTTRRRRPTPRHALGAPGRVDVVLMCANLDDDQRARVHLGRRPTD